MKNDAVQFSFKRIPEDFGVFTDTFNTNIYLRNCGSAFRQIKSDDVSEIVMVEKLPVYFQQPLVGTENIINGRKPFFLLYKEGFYKAF